MLWLNIEKVAAYRYSDRSSFASKSRMWTAHHPALRYDNRAAWIGSEYCQTVDTNNK